MRYSLWIPDPKFCEAFNPKPLLKSGSEAGDKYGIRLEYKITNLSVI